MAFEPLDALDDALAAWRKTRHPRFAAIADWATARALPTPRALVGDSGKKADHEAWLALLAKGDVLDVPRLVATIGGGKSATAAERVVLLAKRDDPRVVSGLLALLAAPPYRAQTAMPFFRACVKALAAADDPRVRPALAALADRYKSVIETSVGDLVGALLRRTAEGLEAQLAPLSPAMEKKCGELEAHFEAERSTTRRAESTQRSARKDDDALLAAIYAVPKDDAPRLVYADTLTERGDVRGEFITLQLARARGQATPAQRQRERELVRDAKRTASWCLPLSQGGECHLARGFPDAMSLDPRTVKLVTDTPALRLLESLTGLDRGKLAMKTAKALLESPHLEHLTSLGGLSQDLLEGLDGAFPWPDVGLRFFARADELARFPHLRKLSMSPSSWEATLPARPFVGQQALEVLSLAARAVLTEEQLAPLTSLTTLELPNSGQQADLSHLAALPKLTTLKLGWSPTAKSLAGLKLEHLSCRWLVDFDAAALVASLPGLRTLEVLTHMTAPLAMQALFAEPSVRVLERVSLGGFHFHRPFTAAGLLTVRLGNRVDAELQRLGEALMHVPAGCVSKMVVKPYSDDPMVYQSAPLDERQLGMLARGKLAAPLVQEWW